MIHARPLTRATSDEDHASLPQATAPQAVPEGANLDHPALYFNRELGDVDFNWRVFHLAIDERTPLLERLRFLAITASNLDEFFQKRVGGLKRQEAAGVSKLSPDGRTPSEQLALIRQATCTVYRTMHRLWEETLRPALREAGIAVIPYPELSEEEEEGVKRHFRHNIYPILSPLAVDPGRPFPFISNLSLSLAITLRRPGAESEHFVRLKVPDNLDSWLEVGPDRFVLAQGVLAHNVHALFPGMEVVSVHPFRVIRNADIRRDEEEADDLLAMISEELRERRFAPVVRLEVAREMPQETRDYLQKQLEIVSEDVYEAGGLLDLSVLFELADLPRPALRFPPWEPVVPTRLTRDDEGGPDMFSILRESDVLVHHPYERFDASVQRLVEEAAEDDGVLAIKGTLYRTGEDSPVVAAFVRAAERGKHVAVLVEVKARFDEANNIEWGERLEEAGVHVAYGLVGLKTHTKVMLIVRREGDTLRTYAHIGTGNYHAKTARLYSDLGFMTADADIGNDLVNLFHALTGHAPEQHYDRLLVAPRDMRRAFIGLVEEEIAHGEAGRILVKMNALDDTEMIHSLYRASQAGVSIDLIIRGHSRLRPGLPGYSDNIRVMSILGRFLEHDRIFLFGNGGDSKLFLGSADWRRRNLSDRVEAVVPVEDETLKARLVSILEDALSDNRLAWDLCADGRYELRYPRGESERNYQTMQMQRALERAGRT